jgi:hypothetical protein
MSAVERFLENVSPVSAAKVNALSAIRMLATNKEIRIFLTALCKYSPDQWACFIRNCKLVFSLMQSSILIKDDSEVMDALLRIPHVLTFFRRLTEND